MNLQGIQNKLNWGIPLPIIKGKTLLEIGKVKIVWWGFSERYKWRWNITHIDFGIISIYGISDNWFWQFIALLIKPLRNKYHNEK